MTQIIVKNISEIEKKAGILLKSSIIAEKDFSFVNNGNGNYTITIGEMDASSGCIIGEYVEFSL